MKNRIIIGLVAAVLMVALLPSAVFAAKPVPFSAGGGVTGISDGTVFPAGKSGRWVVVERDITGVLSGDIEGSFDLTYKANVEMATQAGNLHGTMTVDDYVLNVNGSIQPFELVPISSIIFLPKLTISGHWNFISGAEGTGEFTAWAIFVPTPDGHVAFIVASEFTMTGQWQQ